MFSKFEGNINLSNERIQINTNERCDTTEVAALLAVDY